MRTSADIRKFYLLIFVLFPLNLFCQQDHVFALQSKASSRIDVDTIIIDHTQLEPFESQMIISGLVFSGEINLHSDTSLVRLILMDADYNEYLIYEAYPILSGSEQFSVTEAGEETILLDQITPSRVSIELVDATIYLKEFIISQEDKYLAATKSALSLQQSKYKIDRINQNIQDLGQTWVAGETSISKLSYQEKISMFGGRVPNFQGFEYYVGGVFVLPGALSEGSASKSTPSAGNAQEESPHPDEFSWQDRHNEDWLTPVKHQGWRCNSCFAFGAAAAAELLVNLYYNRHLDYNLSEQQVVSCTAGFCGMGGIVSETLDLIKDTGIVMEDCFPYTASDQDCSEICSDPSERIKIGNWVSTISEEEFKGAVIAGAAAANNQSWKHSIQIVGYKLIEAGDWLYEGGYDSINYISIDQDSPLIGQTAWLCKNSWGESWGNMGFGYFVAGKWDMVVYSLQGPVKSLIYNESDILCADRDGDGYYCWGIGSKPAHCPVCPDEPDGDDSDPCIGPLDEFGNFTFITPTPEANDSIILIGSSPDLYVHGSNVRWYSDKEHQNLVYEGELFSTGHTETGTYTYYVTQTIAACESAADDVSLSIMSEIPRPAGHDTVINKKAQVFIRVEGEPGAEFKWYEDPLLAILLHTGESYEPVLKDTGRYTYFVTQTLCTLESAPDTVLLTISDFILIQDSAFLHALIDRGADTSRDRMISNEEAEAIISLVVSGYEINDMKGIEAFTNLETLNCEGNQLVRLDVSNNRGLIQLNCSYNFLYELDVSNNIELTQLYCSNNRISRLDVSCNTQLGKSCGNYGHCWSLDISDMPTLEEVCVWDSFHPDSIGILGRNQCFQLNYSCGTCSSSTEALEHVVSKLSVFPNPGQGMFTIETSIPDLYDIKITSLNGQLIYSQKMEGSSHQVDLSSFSKGVFFITISSKDFVTTRKIFKL